MDDKRRVRRTRVLKAGTISFGGTAISCAVRNLTRSGAMLDVASPLGVPREFTLVISSEEVRRECRSYGSRKGASASPSNRMEKLEGAVDAGCKGGTHVAFRHSIDDLPYDHLMLWRVLQAKPRAGSSLCLRPVQPVVAGNPHRTGAGEARLRDEDISVRNGFLRYLQGPVGEEFTAVHFDQIGCGNRAEVCTSSGCLHRVFVSRKGLQREVWRGKVFEIDMSIVSGVPSIEVHCGGYDHSCCRRLIWNGEPVSLKPEWKSGS